MKKYAIFLSLMLVCLWTKSAGSEPTATINSGSDLSNEKHRPLTWSEDFHLRLSEHWHPAEFKGSFRMIATISRTGQLKDIKILSHSPDSKADESIIVALNKVVFPSSTRAEGPAGDFQPVSLVFNDVLAKRCRDLYASRTSAATRPPEGK